MKSGTKMVSENPSVDEIALARAWVEWLVDTRTGYADRLLQLSEPERRRDRGASFPSLEDIFLHILDDNVWWFESIPEGRQEAHKRVEGPLSSAEIRQQVERVAQIGKRLADSLTTSRLNTSFVIRGLEGGTKPFEMKCNLRTIVWHMVEEELQHRGEMNALFWQMDVNAPTRAWFSSSLAE